MQNNKKISLDDFVHECVLLAELTHHLFIYWPGYFASDSPTLSGGTNQNLTLLEFSH